jgi:hypothetical protein
MAESVEHSNEVAIFVGSVANREECGRDFVEMENIDDLLRNKRVGTIVERKCNSTQSRIEATARTRQDLNTATTEALPYGQHEFAA